MSEQFFNSRQMIGQDVLISLKNGYKLYGTLVGFYERSHSAVTLKNYHITKPVRDEDGNDTDEWVIDDEGEFIFVKGEGYWDLRIRKSRAMRG